MAKIMTTDWLNLKVDDLEFVVEGVVSDSVNKDRMNHLTREDQEF